MRLCLPLLEFVFREPLLVACLALTSFGSAWLSCVLCWNFPWLLPFAGAGGCLALRIMQALCCSGFLSLLPVSVTQTLDLPPYVLIQKGVIAILLPLLSWVRLVLLATVQLDEEQRELILAELDEEFRREAFYRPTITQLPGLVRLVLLGNDGLSKASVALASNSLRPRWSPTYQNMSDGDSQLSETPRSDVGGSGTSIPRRSLSTENLLQLLRNTDPSHPASEKKQASLQKMFDEKLVDHAMRTVVNGGLRSYDMLVSPAVQTVAGTIGSAYESVTTPPSRVVMRIPWEVTRLTLKVWSLPLYAASAVLSSGTKASVEDKMQPTEEDKMQLANGKTLRQRQKSE